MRHLNLSCRLLQQVSARNFTTSTSKLALARTLTTSTSRLALARPPTSSASKLALARTLTTSASRLATPEIVEKFERDRTLDGFRLTGTAIVTGAGSGIGRETALTMARAGIDGMALADIDQEAVRKVAEECKAIASNPDYKALPVTLDITDNKGVEEMVRETTDKFGRVDYAVNSAGMSYQTTNPITDFDQADLQLMHDIHVKGTLNFMQYVIRAMEKQEFLRTESRGRSGVRHIGRGAIVNIGSLASIIGRQNRVQYCAAKAGVIAATRVAALEYGDKGIRVNCVAPAAVEGPMVDKIAATAPEMKIALKGRIPLRRLAEIEEVADTIIFLCSPLSSYLHGTTVTVDGGLTMSTA